MIIAMTKSTISRHETCLSGQSALLRTAVDVVTPLRESNNDGSHLSFCCKTRRRNQSNVNMVLEARRPVRPCATSCNSRSGQGVIGDLDIYNYYLRRLFDCHGYKYYLFSHEYTWLKEQLCLTTFILSQDSIRTTT